MDLTLIPLGCIRYPEVAFLLYFLHAERFSFCRQLRYMHLDWKALLHACIDILSCVNSAFAVLISGS